MAFNLDHKNKVLAFLRHRIFNDRVGPDIIIPHLFLFSRFSRTIVSNLMFANFGSGSAFRPGSYAVACSKIFIGDNVIIRPGSYLYADPRPNAGRIVISNNVLIGNCVHIYTNNHSFEDTTKPILRQGYPRACETDSVLIKEGSWIGSCSIILPGVTIGKNCVVGAGSVVTKSIPDFTLAVGSPAKVIRNL